MNVSDERTRSVWMNTKVAPRASTLDQSLTADTVIVGAGITGLSTAYELACRGQSVVVLDRGPIGYGMTARTTAHLTSLCDDSFDSLIQARGLEVAKLFHESQVASIDRMEEIHQAEQIDCDFRRLDGILFPALGSDPSDLNSSLELEPQGRHGGDRRQRPTIRWSRQLAMSPLSSARHLSSAEIFARPRKRD